MCSSVSRTCANNVHVQAFLQMRQPLEPSLALDILHTQSPAYSGACGVVCGVVWRGGGYEGHWWLRWSDCELRFVLRRQGVTQCG
jgi:hypothetical protein